MKTIPVKEAAQRLEIKLNTLYGMIRRGVIRHTKVGGRSQVPLEDIEAYEMDVAELRTQFDNDMLVQQIVRKRLFTPLYVDPA